MPGATMSRSYVRKPRASRTRCASGSIAVALSRMILTPCCLRSPSYPKVRLSIERTPLTTRFENGQEMNLSLGSSRTTSIAGSCMRTYLAAVAPPQPPPITITRRPLRFGARSPGVLVVVGAPPVLAQPARPERATTADEALRNSLRVIRAMTFLPEATVAELPR